MLFLTSPAKTMAFTKPLPQGVIPSSHLFPHQTADLVNILQAYSANKLQQLMEISPDLAHLNYNRFQTWNHPSDVPRPAIFTYAGDIYREMFPYTYTAKQRTYAQESVRIISGLYGLVRPLDAIQAYRLEMNIKLTTQESTNLYDFWKHTLTDYLAREITSHNHQVVINLASKEYSDAIDFTNLPCPVVTIEFRQHVRGKLQNVGLLSKRARGMMLEFAIKNMIMHTTDLKAFATKGYHFVQETPTSLLFTQES